MNFLSRSTATAKNTPDGGYEITMWFYGTKWFLKTVQSLRYWMVKADDWVVWVPLKTCATNRRMHSPYDSPGSAIFEAKFQIFRLRYQKISNTFHEQHIHQFPTTPQLEGSSQGSGPRSDGKDTPNYVSTPRPAPFDQ